MNARWTALRQRVLGTRPDLPQRLGLLLFWAWNLVFLAFMVLGFAPTVLPEMLASVERDEFPVGILVNALVLALIPAAAVLLALTRLRSRPERLFALGYGVEGPLMLLVAIRFFAIRELTPAVGVMLALAGIGLAAFLWELLDADIEARGGLATTARAIALSMLLLAGLYTAVLLLFYVVPLAAAMVAFAWIDLPRAIVEVWRDFWTFDWWRDLWRNLEDLRFLPFAVLGSILFAMTVAVFVAMPVVLATLYIRAWRRAVAALAARVGPLRARLVSAVAMAACITLVASFDRQPQAAAFAVLEDVPATADAARDLVARERDLRAGLLNAYLARYRYLSAVGEVYHIREIYRTGDLRLSDDAAMRVQGWYESLLRPLLYRPVTVAAAGDTATGGTRVLGARASWDNRAFPADAERAAELYERFFDRPIDRAERASIVQSVQSTWMIDQARQARLDVDDREVYLERQSVTVAEHGDWAEVELYEVYRNQTFDRQEVVYAFSLPESAVVTGVWLGNSDDRAARFQYRVSPRGAAQQLYREEVRRNVDPALVEQIGPRQYRLRVFPILPRQRNFGARGDRMEIVDGPPLHLWLTYRVLAAGVDDAKGDTAATAGSTSPAAWPLPRLGELRNVYWDARTVRTVIGTIVPGDDPDWLPPTAPASGPIVRQAHRVDFPNGETVIARPLAVDAAANDADATAASRLRPGARVAVVLDRSRSMAEREPDVTAALADLWALAGEEGAAIAVDVYLTAAEFRGEAASVVPIADMQPGDLLPFGGQHPAEMLVQFGNLRGDRQYDAVLVLTDGSTFAAPPDGIAAAAPDAPLWMVHLGGDFPPGYDDATLEAIQASGGGVAASVDEALTRLAAGDAPLPVTAATTASDSIVAATSATLPEVGRSDVVDGYRWSVVKTADLAAIDGARALASAAGGSSTAADVVALPHEDDFGPVAARRVILGAMQQARGDLARVESLDALHAIAVDQSIVTPYSSMIVLVSDAQQRRLAELEGNADRFEREVEGIGETPDERAALTVTGVPEPEEWLLLALAAAMLAWHGWRRWQEAAAV